MNNNDKFIIACLKKISVFLSRWMVHFRMPARLFLIITGIISTAWFLIRVIPKPSRATYPCMQATAPLMSGFIVYLLSLGGVVVFFRRAKAAFSKRRYIASGILIVCVIAGLINVLANSAHNIYGLSLQGSGPDDGPNQPVGEALGINPGRVVWIWNPDATNENCTNSFDAHDWFFKPENTNCEVVENMVRNSLINLTGAKSVPESWDILFRYHNVNRKDKNTGYISGEKIFIKINQGTSRLGLSKEDKENGFYYPDTLPQGEEKRKSTFGATEAGPYIVLELLRELVNESGIAQKDISVGDPMTDICGHNYEVWFAEFPDVAYTGKFSTNHGRTLIYPTNDDLVFYSDKSKRDKLYDVILNADYIINVANLKPHFAAGISLTAKNHFGSQARTSALHLHSSLIVPYGSVPSNAGYHKYRVQVDLMGSRYLGQNTVLYIVDGLFGGGANETRGPVKYFMAPFNNDWCNSIFLSQDQVALESVCFDFLRTEWNGINRHHPSNNTYEDRPNVRGVDDYLHQAADPRNWPEGITYDPDNSGNPIKSLGTHEHWNSADTKQYSRNLGLKTGIELVSLPDTLVNRRFSIN